MHLFTDRHLFVSVCVCGCVRMSVWLCLSVGLCGNVCVYVHKCMCINMHMHMRLIRRAFVYLFLCACVCARLCVSVGVRVCMCVRLFVCVLNEGVSRSLGPLSVPLPGQRPPVPRHPPRPPASPRPMKGQKEAVVPRRDGRSLGTTSVLIGRCVPVPC